MLTPLLIATAVLAQTVPEVWAPPDSAVPQVQPAPTTKAGLAAPAEPDDPDEVSKWYGAPALLGDAALLTATTALFYTGHEILARIPLATFVITGPLTHSAHGLQSRTLVSLGLRTAVAAGGVAVLGATTFEWSSLGPKVFLGALIGTSLVDSLLMSWVRVPRPSAPGAGVYVTPVVHVAGGGAGLSLGGRF